MGPSNLKIPSRCLRSNMRVAVLGCIHAPHNPGETWDWAMGILQDFRPNCIVNTGDHQEASAVSHHLSDDEYPLEEEYRVIADQLRQLRSTVRDRGVLVRHHGNHEFRCDPRNQSNTSGKRLRYTLSEENHEEMREEIRHWRTVPYRSSASGCFRLGQLVTRHGHWTGSGSDEREALNTVSLVNAPLWSLMARTHTHVPKGPTRCRRTQSVPLPFYYANAGTLGPLDPAYAYRMNTAEWGPGILLVELKLQPHYESKEWEAELVSPG